VFAVDAVVAAADADAVRLDITSAWRQPSGGSNR